AQRALSGARRADRRPPGTAGPRGALGTTAKHCTKKINYATGSGFSTSPDQVHLARNEGTETLIIHATYLVPKATPALPLRIDKPSPGPECPL
ncbi:MAG: hypothetical protein ACRDLZ_02995, partial [Gaiellaceae bacterium]